MHPALARAFDRLRDVYAEDAFERRVHDVTSSFGGLLDEEAVALFVLDEHGRNDGAVLAIVDCRGRPEATVVVAVDRVHPSREFAREGATGRVANVDVSDASGTARLVLWDRDVERVEDGSLVAGSRVRVVNARVKDSRFGIELHATAWTRLEVEGAPDPARRKLLTDTLPDVAPASPTPTEHPAARQTRLDEAPPPAPEGPEPEPLASARAGDTLHVVRAIVRSVAPTRPFRRKDGSTGFVATVDVEDASGRATVTLWDEAVRAARRHPPGSEIEMTDLVAKVHEGRLELHSTRTTRVAAAPPR